MWFATSIFDLAMLGQISWWQTTLTFPPWGVYLLNTLQSYGLYNICNGDVIIPDNRYIKILW